MHEQRNFALIRSQGELDDLVGRLAQFDDPVGIDIETGYDGEPREKVALHPEEAYIAGVSISGDPRWARYIPLRHDYYSGNLDQDRALATIGQLDGRFVAHHDKFERRFFRRAGFDWTFKSCTMLEAFVLSEWQRVGLKYLSKARLNYEQAELDSLFPGMKKKDMISVRFNPLDPTDPKVIAYACDDAALCLEHHGDNYPRVEGNQIFQLERQITPILIEMEEEGLLFDFDLLRASGEECAAFLQTLERDINTDLTAAIGRPIMLNLASPAQVGKVLFGELGLTTAQKTLKGADSTSAIALESLRKQYPVVQKILWWKELTTLHTRYLTKWPKDYSYAEDGRTHPSISQALVGTGRFAVEGPPYQQTPKKYHYEAAGKVFDLNFRRAIVARPGYYLFHFDYSQVELRAIAGAAQEPTLMMAFDQGVDVHSATAALMLSMPREAVQEQHRDIGKTMNFALMYQMGPKSLSDRLGISRERARELYDLYFSSYSAIALWVERAKERGKSLGYATTHFGRKYTIWEFQSPNKAICAKGERVAVNMPIQGWAADYMKIAMVRARAALAKAELLPVVKLIMNNHDALTYEVRNDVNPQTLIDLLAPAVMFPVPGFPKIEAEWSMGLNWGEMRKLKLDDAGQIAEQVEIVDEDPFAAGADDEDSPAKVQLDLSLLAKPTPLAQELLNPPREPGQIVPAINMDGSYVGGPDARYQLEQDFAKQREVRQRLQEQLAAEPGKIIVEIKAMPYPPAVAKFMALLAHRPHHEESVTVLRTPEGDIPFFGQLVRMADAPEISLMFGQAEVKEDVEMVDVASVMQGLQL